MVDGSNCQIEVRRENCPLQRDVVANLPAVLLRQRDIDQRSRPVQLPGLQLIRRDNLIRGHLQIFVGIRCQLREKMLRPFIDIAPAEPGEGATALTPECCESYRGKRPAEKTPAKHGPG